jgi:polyhydroxyalkanoate synthesis regulator phasin
MKTMRTILLSAIVAAALPLAALAQMDPAGGPPPEMRAQMMQMHEQAKTQAYNDLSPAHRAQVQTIVDKVNAGSLAPNDATAQIDALLTPAETTAVLATAKSMHDKMRQMMMQSGGMQGPPPGGPMHEHRTADAGRFFLMLSRPMPPPPNGQ